MDAAPLGKLSEVPTITFRPGSLGAKLADLAEELSTESAPITVSDILRDGLTAFWPQIEAYLTARQQTQLDAGELAKLTSVCARVREHGISHEELERVLDDLLARKLTVV